MCGNYWNSLLSRFFYKNFVKSTFLAFLLIKLLKNWFHGKKFRWERISRFSTLHSVERNYGTLVSHFLAKSKIFIKEVTKELISRNIFWVREILCFFHSVCVAHWTAWKNAKFSLTEMFSREISSLVTLLVKTLISRNFCDKSVRVNFRIFHSVHCAQCDEKFTATRKFSPIKSF